MSKNTINTNANTLHPIKFFKTPSKYILACIPKCGSSYYAWSIFLSRYPSAQKILEKNGENIKSLNNKDALSFSKCILKEDIKEESVILPFRDPMCRFTSIFLYLQDISEQEIIGVSIDQEIRDIVMKSYSNNDIFFDYFVDSWEKINIAVPQALYYTNTTTLIAYNNTARICELINSTHISQIINKGTGSRAKIHLSASQIKKIKEIYKDDYKLKQCIQ